MSKQERLEECIKLYGTRSEITLEASMQRDLEIVIEERNLIKEASYEK